MWNNIGRKVQKLAKVICWIGIIFSIIYGIAVIAMSFNVRGPQSTVLLITGIAVAVLGPLLFWLRSWVTYAIGEAAEAAEKLKNN